MEVSDRTKKFGIMACLLASFISTYSLYMVSVSLKDIQSSLGIRLDEALWFTWSPIIATLGLCFISSALSSRFGKKRLLEAGLIITIITAILTLFTNDYFTVLVTRVIQGGGMSFLYVSMVSIMTDLATKDENESVMGYNNIFSQLGNAIAILAGYVITVALGWRYTGLVLVPIALISLYLIKDVPNVTDPKHETHLLDQIIFSSAVIGFLFALGDLGKRDDTWLFITAAVLMVLFIYRQLNRDNWIMNYRLFIDNIPFRIAAVTALCMYITYYNTLQLTGGLIQSFNGSLVLEIAVVFSFLSPLLQVIVTGVVTNRYKDVASTRKLGGGIMISFLTAALLLLIPVLDETGVITVCCIALVLMAIAPGLFVAPNTSLMMSSVDPSDRNDASSINNFIRHFNKINGSILVVVMVAGAGDTTEAFKFAMSNLALLFVFALVIAVLVLYMYTKSDKLHI